MKYKKNITINLENIKISNSLPMVVFGGLNVLEKYDITMKVCEHFVKITNKLNIPFVFKASFDKANRSSINSYRGPGLKNGIKIFSEIKKKFNVKIMTDIHDSTQADHVSEVVDIIQIPAFLARQTDLIASAANTGKVLNIKKPQFLSPDQIIYIIEKIKSLGNKKIIICERGTMFGYNNLIVDILGLDVMKKISGGYPIILDVTHSLQNRKFLSPVSSGNNDQVNSLSRAGISVGIAGIFIESHTNPEQAKCDGPCAIPLKKLELTLNQAKTIDDLIKSFL
ncbi:kdsA [Wigglesworthia glossinidia endosymbiont of Glossina brevipalpis]|uniref:3-deoxy-8-phosphooctulonate synthase n=1 Tax=Wigglesworthia glossinidia brevipalpis TaxID=36870 RepID=Q8D2L1_WIGBR|nr:kdsA [Wigglesworthia glossinidia endosymbiont of Glossina brevipalpis]